MNTNQATARNHRSCVGFVRAALLVTLVTGIAFTVRQAQAATTDIDPTAGAPDDGTLHNPASNGGPCLNGAEDPGYMYDFPETSSYTNTSPTGGYWVEVSWGVHPTHATDVTYAVNGIACRTVDQTKDVAGAGAVATWSGFKALNRGGVAISLTNGVSQITSTAHGAGSHTRGLWRATRLTGTMINPASFGTASATSSSPGNGNYYYQLNPDGPKAYAIGSVLAPGVYKLEISWGVHPAHSTAVTYSYNQTGAGGFAGAIIALTNVNQQALNDGRTCEGSFGFGTWSGFRNLGVFTVEAGSQIWLNGSGSFTMGVIQATPTNGLPADGDLSMDTISEVPVLLKTEKIVPVESKSPDLSRYTPGACAVFERINWDKMDGARHIVGFNYQPSWGSSGPEIWVDKFDAAKYKAELARGKELFPQMNTVRIWLSWGAWKKNPEAYIANLTQAFATCKDLDLLMIPVLFTVWGGNPPYDPINTECFKLPFEKFEKYVAATLSACPGNVLAWDLCNEPDHRTHNKWLKKLANYIHKEYPGHYTTIGTLPDYASRKEGKDLFDYCDLWTEHDYQVFSTRELMDKTVLNAGNIEAKKNAYLNTIRNSLKVLEKAGLKKPVVSSECCWGSLDDEVRSLVVEGTLDGLTKLGIGFLPHALYTSPVADLHTSELGPVANPGYMAFIRRDGSLRPFHDVFNKYAAIATGVGQVNPAKQ